MKPLTEYTDFRTYLNEWVEDRKSQGLPGSNRWFAMKMGINSTSWLTSVLKGVKGLSKATANRLSQLLKHSPIETRYFETMVFFNQARTIEERNRYYKELNALQKLKDVRTVRPNQYDLYSTWYHSAVRSLIGMHLFGADAKDFERLASLVSPPITASQARRSVKLLEQLDLIKLNGQGFFELHLIGHHHGRKYPLAFGGELSAGNHAACAGGIGPVSPRGTVHRDRDCRRKCGRVRADTQSAHGRK